MFGVCRIAVILTLRLKCRWDFKDGKINEGVYSGVQRYSASFDSGVCV